VDACSHAMTIHWSEGTRQDAGIRPFNVERLADEIGKREGISLEGEKLHRLFPYILKLAETRTPIMLSGPAGTGKSYAAKQLSRYLGLPYGEVPMSPGATRGDLLGRPSIGGVDKAIALASVAARGDENALEELSHRFRGVRRRIHFRRILRNLRGRRYFQL
jgi:hypothetical protein